MSYLFESVGDYALSKDVDSALAGLPSFQQEGAT